MEIPKLDTAYKNDRTPYSTALSINFLNMAQAAEPAGDGNVDFRIEKAAEEYAKRVSDEAAARFEKLSLRYYKLLKGHHWKRQETNLKKNKVLTHRAYLEYIEASRDFENSGK